MSIIAIIDLGRKILHSRDLSLDNLQW